MVANLQWNQPNGLLNISQKPFADYLVEKVGNVIEKSVPMPVGIKLEEFSKDEPVGTWPFRELIVGLV